MVGAFFMPFYQGGSDFYGYLIRQYSRREISAEYQLVRGINENWESSGDEGFVRYLGLLMEADYELPPIIMHRAKIGTFCEKNADSND